WRSDAGERRRRQLEYRHGAAELACNGRAFEPDEAGADHRDLAARAERRAECQGILDGAQVGERLAVATRNREAPRPRAGREQQAIVGDGAAVGEAEALRRAVDLGDLAAEAKLYAGIGVVACGLKIGALDRNLAGEQLLRERRALIGWMKLVADQHDLAG